MGQLHRLGRQHLEQGPGKLGTVLLEVLGDAGVLDEQELAIAKEELSGQMQKKIKARSAAAQESLAAIDREWEAKIEELNQRQADALKALDEDKEGRLSEAKAALAKARNQFAELVEEAERKRARGTIYGMPNKKGPQRRASTSHPVAFLRSLQAMPSLSSRICRSGHLRCAIILSESC